MMKLLVVAVVLGVAQCQARDHRGQYTLPSPRQDPEPRSLTLKSRNNDVNLIPRQTRGATKRLNLRDYLLSDFKSDVKTFILHKLQQFQQVFDGNGWTNVSRWLTDLIQWLKSTKENENRNSKRPFRKT